MNALQGKLYKKWPQLARTEQVQWMGENWVLFEFYTPEECELLEVGYTPKRHD